jgi:hypothetical protein
VDSLLHLLFGAYKFLSHGHGQRGACLLGGAFDSTVAGLSEADLVAAVGTAAVVGSLLVRSMVGSCMLSGGGGCSNDNPRAPRNSKGKR